MGRELEAGKMYRPTDITVDRISNDVYVVEQFNHRVSKWIFTNDTFIFNLFVSWGNNVDGTTGEPGPVSNDTDNFLDHPTGITFDASNEVLYVTDTLHNRIRVIDPTNPNNGAFIASVGQGGKGDGDFHRPAGIAININTNAQLVVADEFNHRVVVYDTNGGDPIFNAELVDPSTGGGLRFNRPHGVLFDADENTFNITDTYRGIISRYNASTLAFVDQIGSPGTTGTDLFFPGSGERLLGGTISPVFADTRNNIIKTINNSTIANTTVDTNPPVAGTGNGELYYPESVSAFQKAVTDYVLAANTLNNRIEIYSNTSEDLTNEDPFNFGSP